MTLRTKTYSASSPLDPCAVIGFLAWSRIRSHLATKAKAYEEKKHLARIDLSLLRYLRPSWHDQANRLGEFFAGVERLAVHKGVPSEYVQPMLEKEINVRRLIWYVGSLEEHGATWRELQMAVVDQIVEWWETEQRQRTDSATSHPLDDH